MRIIVKVGTNLLTAKDGSLDKTRIENVVKDIIEVRKIGHDVVLITSGAIGAGMGKMKIKKRPTQLKEKQALAAIGQPLLMDIYKDFFSKYGVSIAQVLLTRYGMNDRKQYLNARSTMLTLLDLKVVPIVNENDTVAVEEINFGGNDILGALVAAKIGADKLVILTDVDGLYRDIKDKSSLIEKIDCITDDIKKCACSRSGSQKGIGGMTSKIEAAEIAVSAGITTVIANGLKSGILKDIVFENSFKGTVFMPSSAFKARKCWIAFGTKCKGKIVIDDGAQTALVERKKSLLASGIVSVEGTFEVGEPVGVCNKKGTEVARGLTYYSSSDITKIKGKKSSEIQGILGHCDYSEVIHRDNIVIL